jgi:hypothetical protein
LSRLDAALVLAAPAPTMRLAVARVALSGLEAALLLTPFASTMSDAERRATISSPLGAALLLTLSPAHGTPPAHATVAPPKPNGAGATSRATYRSVSLRSVWSVLLQGRRLTRWAFFRRSKVQRSAQCSQSLSRNRFRLLLDVENLTPLRCAITAVTHPLSALIAPLVHTGHHTHDGGSARAGQTLGSAKVVNSAWAGDVRWVCSRAGWTATPPHPPPPGSQAACPFVPLLQTLMVGSNTRHSTSTARRRDTLECTCFSEGGCSEGVGVGELPQLCENSTRLPPWPAQCRWESAVHGQPPYTHTHRCTSRVFSVSRTAS